MDRKRIPLRYKGENITIVMSRYATWGVVFHGEWRWDYLEQDLIITFERLPRNT